MSGLNAKPIFDAMRAVCGPLSQDAVNAMNVAIAASTSTNDQPIFDCVRRYDDDSDGLSQLEFGIVKRAANLYFGHATQIVPKKERQIGADGLALIQTFEGLRLDAYLCPAGVWTIGYGSTGPHVKPGMRITKDRAIELLGEDLDRFEEAVNRLAPKATQNQFDAMVALAFNIGIGAFRRSSVLKYHTQGDHKRAAGAFMLFVKAGGKVLQGLVNRRNAERKLYQQW